MIIIANAAGTIHLVLPAVLLTLMRKNGFGKYLSAANIRIGSYGAGTHEALKKVHTLTSESSIF